MIQNFKKAKKIMHQIAKDYNIKNLEDWKNFTDSKDFEKFRGVIPKKPWVYYSKENVLKRRSETVQ